MPEVFNSLTRIALTCVFSSAIFASEIVEITVLSTRDRSGSFTATKWIPQVDPQSHTPVAQVADLIAELPGVSLNGQGGSLQTFSIRGLSRARIQTRLSGIPLHTERRAGNAASFIDPFLLSHVAVLKGPASTLYGSGALGGVIDLESRRFEGINITSSYYSNGDQTMMGIGWGNADWSVGVASRDHARSRDTNNQPLNDKMERLSASLAGHHRLTRNLTLSGTIIHTSGSDIGKSSADFPTTRVTHYPRENHDLAQLLLAGKSWSIQVYGHDHLLETEVLVPETFLTTSESTALDYGVHITKRWQINNAHYRFGIDSNNRAHVNVKEKTVRQDILDLTTPLKGRQNTAGFYADAQWSTKDTLLHAGLRFTRAEQKALHASSTSRKWTGVARIRKTINSHLNVYGEVSRGFRFPELNETFFNGTTGRGTLVGYPDLKPESSISFEIGTLFDGDISNMEVSAYHMNIKDYIERFEIADRQYSFRNIKHGTITGIELQARLNLTQQMQLTVNGHWLEGEDKEGQNLQDMTPPRAGVTLKNSRPWGSWEFAYQHRFATNRIHSTESPTDAFNLLSITAFVNLSDQFSMKIWALNVLNEKFTVTRDNISSLSTNGGIGVSLDWYN